MSRDSKTPVPYVANDVPLWDSVKGVSVPSEMYFNIPYEQSEKWLEMGHKTESDIVCRKLGPMDDTIKEWARCNLVGPETPVAGIGIWGDAASFNTRDSLYVMLFNFLSIGCYGERIPFCIFSKSQTCRCGCQGRCTFEKVWEVMVWALRVYKAGILPSVRHDKVAFRDSKKLGDKTRAKHAGKRLRIRAGCTQKRGDWSWMKQCMDMISWNSGARHNGRTCWKCFANCTTHPWWHFGLDALWRFSRVSDALYKFQSMHNGRFISGLFGRHIYLAKPMICYFLFF